MFEPEWKRFYGAARALDSADLARHEPLLCQKRWILAAGRRLEYIAESLADDGRSGRIHMKVDFMAGHNDQRPHVIDSMRMIRMLMREKDSVEMADILPQQLLTQIRPRIDEHLGPGSVIAEPFDEDGATPAPIFRIFRIASAPALADPRDATRGSTAENCNPEAHAASAADPAGGILLKRRKTLALVAAAISDSDTFFNCARTLAVSVT